jgi:hypothetical protein
VKPTRFLEGASIHSELDLSFTSALLKESSIDLDRPRDSVREYVFGHCGTDLALKLSMDSAVVVAGFSIVQKNQRRSEHHQSRDQKRRDRSNVRVDNPGSPKVRLTQGS